MASRDIRYGVLLLVCFHAAACQFSSGHSGSKIKESGPSNNSVSMISDSDWELRLINEIPKEASPDHIRCISSGHCWLWNVKSIWLADNAGRWRQVYTLPLEQRKELDAIESVSMISHQAGWFNSHRAIYQTRDGGVNWNPISAPVLNKEGAGFSSVIFRDERRGWLAGGEFRPKLAGEPVVNNAVSGDGKQISIAAIWQTTDGGATWQTKDLKRRIGRFLYMEFWNDTGVAFGDAGCVFTNDGGESWKDMQALIPEQKETADRSAITGAYFVDHDNGWILTSWFENLSTHDGGETWSRFASKVIGPNKDSEYLEPSNVVFANKLEGLLIAGPAGKGSVFKTKGGGKNWTQISANDHFYDLSLSNGAKGFLLGDKGIYSISLRQVNHAP
jgi:photosystem II stability/assembly factor-like uncharacterized protein